MDIRYLLDKIKQSYPDKNFDIKEETGAYILYLDNNPFGVKWYAGRNEKVIPLDMEALSKTILNSISRSNPSLIEKKEEIKEKNETKKTKKKKPEALDLPADTSSTKKRSNKKKTSEEQA